MANLAITELLFNFCHTSIPSSVSHILIPIFQFKQSSFPDKHIKQISDLYNCITKYGT